MAFLVQFLQGELAQAQDNPLERVRYWLDDRTIAGNELWRIAAVFGTLLAGFVVGRFLRIVLNMASARSCSRRRQFLAVGLSALARAVVLIALGVALRIALEFLLLNEAIASLAYSIASTLMAASIAYAAYCLVDVVDYWLKDLSLRTVSRLDDMAVPMVVKTLRGTVIVLGIVQLLTILSDKPVTSIIAGLGVGGLAIGLAAQDTIKHFFGSLMIFSDRPFEMGDQIVVDGHEGNVEAVGFRSTRIRTPDGQLVTIPNGDLASKAIRNVGKRPYLQRRLAIGLAYDTPPDKVRRAIEIVREILAHHEGMKPDMPPRVFFNDLAASSLEIVAMYWYYPADWWKFVELNERVNFEVLRRFDEEGLKFAYPTQRLLVEGDLPESGPESERRRDGEREKAGERARKEP